MRSSEVSRWIAATRAQSDSGFALYQSWGAVRGGAAIPCVIGSGGGATRPSLPGGVA